MAELNRANVLIPGINPKPRLLWCGVVFALGTLMTTLNFLPPVGIEYRIRSEVLISESRLAQIETAIRNRPSHLNGEPRLLQMTVLDGSASASKSSTEASAENLLLVEVVTQWTGSYSDEQHQRWLDEATRQNATDAVDPSLEHDRRLAKWELQTARDYLGRHEFLASGGGSSAGSDDASAFTLAKTRSANGVPATLASQTNVASEQPSDSEFAALTARVAQAEQKFEALERAWLEQVEKTAGVLEFAQRPELSPKSNTIPFWMAASVLLVGLAAGVTAGWTKHRLESAGIRDPDAISTELARVGVPVAGELRLDSIPAMDWGDKARQMLLNLPCGLGRNMTRYGEWILWFWVCIIAVRFVLDPMWRTVLWDSPLAALGRLAMGMP